MAKQYILGIDIGTSGCKTLIVDHTGHVAARAYAEYPLSTPQFGWAEQEAEDWWQAVKKTLKEILKDFESIEDIKGIGLSGQMHGLVALDKEGSVLRPAILWNDQRTVKQCQEIHELTGGVEGLLKLTNNQMLPGYTGGKILWLRENEPSVFEKTSMILNPKDYIRYCLTGEYATEVSDASGTGLFDVRKRKWSQELLDLLDIPKQLLPICYESDHVSGYLKSHLAQEFNVGVELPIVGGGGDAVIQTTGSGLVQSGILGTTLGTAGIVSMALDQCYDNPAAKLQVFCNTIPNRWHTMGVTLTAGGSLRWLKDIIGGPNIGLTQQTDKDVYEVLIEAALMSNPGSEGLLFLPYLIGERCPHTDPDARGSFVGLTLRHHSGDLIRSVLEGVIFSLKDSARLIEGMGIQTSQIRMSGGGAKSTLWRQIHADIFNQEVITVSAAAEGGAYGAALVAGVGVGIWDTIDEATACLKIASKIAPRAEYVEFYEDLYGVYCELYWQLRESFKKLANIYHTGKSKVSKDVFLQKPKAG